MRPVELQQAVDRIVNALTGAGLQDAVRNLRSAQGEARHAATNALRQSASQFQAAIGTLDSAQRAVADTLHLDTLFESDYWDRLLGESNEMTQNGELVRLYSRVMFATSHLPLLSGLLEEVGDAPMPVVAGASMAEAGFDGAGDEDLASDQARLVVRLDDAIERASDPDRVARTIDAIDMLYAASASFSQSPPMELTLDHVRGRGARVMAFSGEREALERVREILASVPAVIEQVATDEQADPAEVARHLPIFAELEQLGAAAAAEELANLRETLHQGAVLVLESGIAVERFADGSNAAAGGGDDYYRDYLREREAMERGELPRSLTPEQERGASAPPSSVRVDDGDDPVDELLKKIDSNQPG